MSFYADAWTAKARFAHKIRIQDDSKLADIRSFAIDSPNGFKVPKYYHISNLIIRPSVWDAKVGLVPEAEVNPGFLNVG